MDPHIREASKIDQVGYSIYVTESGGDKLHAVLASAFDLFVTIGCMTKWWVPLVCMRQQKGPHVGVGSSPVHEGPTCNSSRTTLHRAAASHTESSPTNFD